MLGLYSEYKLKAKSLIAGRMLIYFVLILTAFLLSLLSISAIITVIVSVLHPFVSSLILSEDSPVYPFMYYTIGIVAIIALLLMHAYTRYVSDKIFFLKASDDSTKGAYKIKGKTTILKAFLLGVLIVTLKTLWFIALQIPFLTASSYFAYLLMDGLPKNIIYIFVGGCLALFFIGLFFWFCIIQRYSAARYIFASNRFPSAFGSIKQSTITMKGRCLKTAFFKLSLVPWIVACALLIPIPYVLPYYKMSSAVLIYEFMSREMKSRRGPAIILGV